MRDGVESLGQFMPDGYHKGDTVTVGHGQEEGNETRGGTGDLKTKWLSHLSVTLISPVWVYSHFIDDLTVTPKG